MVDNPDPFVFGQTVVVPDPQPPDGASVGPLDLSGPRSEPTDQELMNAHDSLASDFEKVVARIRDLPDAACPDDWAVVEAVIRPGLLLENH